MKLCIAGKNNIAVNALDYLINHIKIPKTDLMVVCNQNDLGIHSWQKSLKKFAQDNDIKIASLEECYTIEDLIFISLEFDKIVKTKLFKTKQIYNIHFSLLPAYKGMYTSALPIINGEKFSGVTLHKIDDGIDTGDIIDQIRFDILIEDTAKDLYLKYLEHSFDLFKKNIGNLLNNDFTFIKQSHIGSSYYSREAIDYSNLKINFKKSSFEIYNQLRAFIFPEYQLPQIENNKIYKVELTSLVDNYFEIVKKEECYQITGADGFIIKAYFKQK